MFSILRLFPRIAFTAKIAPIVANMVITVMTAQSVDDQAIAAATKRNGRMFVAYLIILLGTAVIIAVFTWLNWDSGNKVQDTIRISADARINEAKLAITKLEGENLKLSGELETQKERTATAERLYLELKNSVKDRTITPSQRQELVKKLAIGPKGKVQVVWASGDTDTYAFAVQVKDYGSFMHFTYSRQFSGGWKKPNGRATLPVFVATQTPWRQLRRASKRRSITLKQISTRPSGSALCLK
jgi:hypothetical protein